MLPPFVPPSARVASENLPLITEFVIDRVEHSFENSFSIPGETGTDDASQSGAVATLPSIDEFVRHEPDEKAADTPEDTVDDAEFVQRTSRSPWGTYEAQHEVATGAESAPPAHTLEPDLLLDRHGRHSGSPDAIVNEVVEPADAWAVSAASTRIDAAPAESAEEAVTEPAAAPSTAASEVWVAEERDAFDWHAAANLAVPPADARRAADEWSSTEWERSGGSLQDHVANLLVQVSKRVRSGELEVQGSKQMGNEAALVAVLAALLGESAKQ